MEKFLRLIQALYLQFWDAEAMAVRSQTLSFLGNARPGSIPRVLGIRWFQYESLRGPWRDSVAPFPFGAAPVSRLHRVVEFAVLPDLLLGK